MKLLYCQICGDIIAPFRGNLKPRWCLCERHAVWWVDGTRGILRVYDKEGPTVAGPAHYNQMCYVLGINNHFLHHPGDINAEVVKQLDVECPDSYLFKRWHSPIIRIRPGYSNDTGWAPLPREIPV